MKTSLHLLKEPEFDFLTGHGREFVIAFHTAMNSLGYDHNGEIGSGYCWGKYMLIYTRQGVKSKQVYARVYLQETGPVLRLFLNDIDRHRAYLETAPEHILEPFTNTYGACQHCHNEKDGHCRFRKSYTLHNRLIEKCNGLTFEYPDPDPGKLDDYLDLFTEFFPPRTARKGNAKLI